MALVALLNFIILTIAFSQEENARITYLASCHKELEDSLTCEAPATLEVSNMNDIVETLGLSDDIRYRERERCGTYDEILKACTERTAKFHEKMGALALESYDISFLNRNEPNLENLNGGKAPDGYKVEKYYGQQPEECFQTGFKAALFSSTTSDHVVFAITGTESSETYSSGKKRETYLSSGGGAMSMLGMGSKKATTVSAKDKDKEDWMPTTGRKQFTSSCAKQMIRDAVELAKSQKKKIIFTGHSLGGALSQAIGHEVQTALLRDQVDAPPVEVVTFMSAGGSSLVKMDEKVDQRLRSTVYVSLGDIVSGFGGHVGEVREMVRKDEYEQQFKEQKLSVLETHTLKLQEFRPLKESLNIKATDISKRVNKYYESFQKK